MESKKERGNCESKEQINQDGQRLSDGKEQPSSYSTHPAVQVDSTASDASLPTDWRYM
jgi:hypothetical protein